MKTLLTLAALVMILGISGCSQDEPTYNNFKDEWKILAATTGAPSSLALVSQPDGAVTSADIFASANGTQLAGTVQKIVEFRENLYLMIPSVFQVVVIDKQTFKQMAVLDFSAQQRIPTDVAFGNATTGYVAHENDTSVTVIDITNFSIGRVIKVGMRPVAIAAVGNQVFVANQSDNTISQIDTRTNTVVATHQVAPAPTFIRPNANGHEVIVLSLGAGKLDTAGIKTPPVITYIDSARIIVDVLSLDDVLIDGANALPTSISVSPKEWAYITVQKGVIRLDTKARKDYKLVSEIEYKQSYYNFRRNEVLLLNGTKGSIIDEITGEEKTTFVIPADATTLIGL
jgi:YVTN family beta-propeller protein